VVKNGGRADVVGATCTLQKSFIWDSEKLNCMKICGCRVVVLTRLYTVADTYPEDF
jgi:hypothetical protein